MPIFFVHTKKINKQGFTLIEVLVTISILSILMMLAAPALKELFVKIKMQSISDDFVQNILKAKNTSVNKNICTLMCASSTSDSETPSCDAKNEGDWQPGWIIFFNADCEISNNAPNANEDVISVRVGENDEYYLKSRDLKTNKIQFDAKGRPGLKSSNEFDLYYKKWDSELSKKFGMNICLDMLGRTRTIPFDKTCNNYK